MQRIFCLTLSLALVACSAGTTPNTPNTSPTTAPAANQALKAFKTITVGKSPHGMAGAGHFVYNSNTADGNISVIDARTDEVVKTLTLTEGKPNYVKATHDGKYILVLNTAANKVHVFDPAQDHLLIHTADLGKGPDKVVLTDDDHYAFFSLTGEARIAGLDFSAGWDKSPQPLSWNTGAGAANGGGHRSLDAAGDWLLVPNAGDNDVSLVNRVTGEHKRLQDGNAPGPVALGTQDGKVVRVIVGNTASQTVSLFDPVTGAKQTLDNVGQGPTEVEIVPELGRAFMTMASSNEVVVIDYLQQRVVGKVAVGKRPVHVYLPPALVTATVQHEGHDHDAPAQEVWVGNDQGDSVSILDAQTLAVKATVAVGVGHHKMAFANGKGYISNITDGTVSVIDRKTLPQP